MCAQLQSAECAYPQPCEYPLCTPHPVAHFHLVRCYSVLIAPQTGYCTWQRPARMLWHSRGSCHHARESDGGSATQCPWPRLPVPRLPCAWARYLDLQQPLPTPANSEEWSRGHSVRTRFGAIVGASTRQQGTLAHAVLLVGSFGATHVWEGFYGS
jgi:hypothetical protein